MITVVIGRSEDCDIRLADPSASRRHATLFVRGDRDLELVDSSSRNGTFLKAGAEWRRITASPVKPTDIARFGNEQVAISSILLAVANAGGGGIKASPDAAKVVRPGGGGESSEAAGAPLFRNPRRNPVTGRVEGED
jgi:pSer/pThr/pTyr-binding forkhead associated (FHA) protein